MSSEKPRIETHGMLVEQTQVGQRVPNCLSRSAMHRDERTGIHTPVDNPHIDGSCDVVLRSLSVLQTVVEVVMTASRSVARSRWRKKPGPAHSKVQYKSPAQDLVTMG